MLLGILMINTKTGFTLLATNSQNSIIIACAQGKTGLVNYLPFGFAPALSQIPIRLKFTGEQQDPITGFYLLGNGYRSFSPALGRFVSSDTVSPFGNGGLNSYAYCNGDPVNLVDPEGRAGEPNALVPTELLVLRSRAIQRTRHAPNRATNRRHAVPAASADRNPAPLQTPVAPVAPVAPEANAAQRAINIGGAPAAVPNTRDMLDNYVISSIRLMQAKRQGFGNPQSPNHANYQTLGNHVQTLAAENTQILAQVLPEYMSGLTHTLLRHADKALTIHNMQIRTEQ